MNVSLISVLCRTNVVRLIDIFGKKNIDNIEHIVGKCITERNIANAIIVKHGNKIFQDKKLVKLIFEKLTDDEIYFLFLNSNASKDNIEEKRNFLKNNNNWNKNENILSKIIELFNLNENFFKGEEKENRISQEQIIPDTFLYPYQQKIKSRLVKSLIKDKDKNRILVHMPTGSGKTRMTTEALVDYWRIEGDYHGYIIWLTDSEELCQQAEETFIKLWKVRGDRSIQLIRLWGDNNIEKLEDEGGIIIASFQKLGYLQTTTSNKKFELMLNIASRSRVIVVDEAHKSTAPTYKQTIQFLSSNLDKIKLIGLTATPGRTDEEQIDELASLYGYNKITLTDNDGKDIDDPIDFLQDNQYLSHITRKKIFTECSITLTKKEQEALENTFEIPFRVLKSLSENEQRNFLIIQEIKNLREKERQIIVFACSVEHAHLITDISNFLGISARCIDGNTLSYDRNKYITDFKQGTVNVLVNYGVLTTGFDAPNTNAVMITRPTSSLVLYSQMIGRGIRGVKMGGTDDCILVDLEDNLQGFPSERKAFNYFNVHWRYK